MPRDNLDSHKVYYGIFISAIRSNTYPKIILARVSGVFVVVPTPTNDDAVQAASGTPFASPILPPPGHLTSRDRLIAVSSGGGNIGLANGVPDAACTASSLVGVGTTTKTPLTRARMIFG